MRTPGCFVSLVLFFSLGCGDTPLSSDDALYSDGGLVFTDGFASDGRRPDSARIDGQVFDGPRADGQLSDGWAAPDGGDHGTPSDLTFDTLSPDMGPVINGTCAQAALLTIGGGGSITVSGSTADYPNQYGTSIDCGLTIGTPIPILGPQAYYRVQLTANQTYRISLANAYAFPRIYLFRSCGASTINSQCTAGVDGTISGTEPSVVFRPPATDLYYIAVDSTAIQNAGSFNLTVEQFPLPHGATCQTAQRLSLSGGSVSVTKNTADSLNEFGSDIDCGFGIPFVGPQNYFRVSLAAQVSYTFSVAAGFGGMIYIFPAQCGDTGAINTACGAGGSGFSGFFLPGGASYAFTPAQQGDYIVAIDTLALPVKGEFQLTVTNN